MENSTKKYLYADCIWSIFSKKQIKHEYMAIFFTGRDRLNLSFCNFAKIFEVLLSEGV